jgi:2-polyprenyl-3-methyl-5-hydroxy-6-metoxy-1,4-benzoquinol methylase
MDNNKDLPPNHGRTGSHSKVARPEDFENTYRQMTPVWEIERPQRTFVKLAQRGQIMGSVLDVGCGTGEHILLAAVTGLDAVGIDTSPTAISRAQEKAARRGLRATFLVYDALQIASLGKQFDTIIDCGMFHHLKDEERPIFADGLRATLRPGGHYFMLCFSDQRLRSGAARTISQEEIRRTFSNDFNVDSIEPSWIEETGPDNMPAWLATITRPRSARLTI